MTRFPFLADASLDPKQQELASRVCGDGRLWPGPYNALARIPAVGLALQAALKDLQKGVLSSDEREVAILVVAADRRCSYGWHAHVPLALAAGVSRDSIKRIGQGSDPEFLDTRLQRIWTTTREILAANTNDQPSLNSFAELNPTEAISLTALVGLYWSVFALVALDLREPRTSHVNLG